MRGSSGFINKSKYLYYKISTLMYFLGAPNYWHEEIEISDFAKKFHDNAARLVDFVVILFFTSIWGSFFTQNSLNEKQKVDRITFALGLPLFYTFVPAIYHYREKVKEVSYNLAITMKEFYNDAEVEKHMIKQAKIYLSGFFILSSSAITLYGVNGVVKVITEDSTFVTIVTAWPHTEDRSLVAGVARVMIYLLYWISFLRPVFTAYIAVLLIIISLSHQYQNLCSYFYNLNYMFVKENLSQEEMEKKYEEAFKIGIQMHSNTLRCTKLTQEMFNINFSVQIVTNITVLLFLMIQMANSERSLTDTTTIAVMSACLLLITGCLWWSAGDVTVEASQLSTAMFHSGWHHCRKEAARRIRPMIVISMCHSQRPVELHCLEIATLSYQSYVAVVRTSYSIFSVLY